MEGMDLFPQSHILIVDDERIIGEILQEFLKSLGARCTCTSSAIEAAEWITKTEFDTILSDVYMPDLTGHDLLNLVLQNNPDTPFILMTGHPTIDNTLDALRLGAYDYLIKPFNLDMVRLTLQRALQFRQMTLDNRSYQQYLEEQVQSRTQELQDFLFHSVQSLSLALEARDPYTQGHGQRVGEIMLFLARQLGIGTEHFETLRLAGLLHDIGKIGVPDSILLKKEKLSPAEYEIMKDHVYIGYKILSPIPYLKDVSRYVFEHHERLDGQGYPKGLRDGEIHLNSRLLAVTEVFDALATERCYKPAWTVNQIMDHFAENAGTVYDPDVCHALLSSLQRDENEMMHFFQIKFA
jgi:putative two-component system response regulator